MPEWAPSEGGPGTIPAAATFRQRTFEHGWRFATICRSQTSGAITPGRMVSSEIGAQVNIAEGEGSFDAVADRPDDIAAQLLSVATKAIVGIYPGRLQ